MAMEELELVGASSDLGAQIGVPEAWTLEGWQGTGHVERSCPGSSAISRETASIPKTTGQIPKRRRLFRKDGVFSEKMAV
jgi:hypothetical protein